MYELAGYQGTMPAESRHVGTGWISTPEDAPIRFLVAGQGDNIKTVYMYTLLF